VHGLPVFVPDVIRTFVRLRRGAAAPCGTGSCSGPLRRSSSSDCPPNAGEHGDTPSPATDDLNRSRPNRRNQVSIATVDKDVEFAVPTVARLTLADRCDASAVVGGPNGRTGRGACGAQGFVRAVLPSGNDLIFCAHHGREQEAALAAAGATIHDETDKINA
jgi:hypothetical protein